jgi:hypothetical protein
MFDVLVAVNTQGVKLLVQGAGAQDPGSTAQEKYGFF